MKYIQTSIIFVMALSHLSFGMEASTASSFSESSITINGDKDLWNMGKLGDCIRLNQPPKKVIFKNVSKEIRDELTQTLEIFLSKFPIKIIIRD